MVDVGEQIHFIDTQDVNLRNVSSSKTYTQLTDVTLEIDSNVTKHHLTDDTVNNVFDLRAISVQGNMIITSEEWAELVTLTEDINGVRPIQSWCVEWMDQSDIPIKITINGQLKTLRPIDSGIGPLTLFFRIEGDEVLTIS